MVLDAIICIIRRSENFGVVADILPAGTFEGNEVRKLKQAFVRVFVSDLDETLAEELKSGVKKFKSPSEVSQFYIDLDNQGYTTATNEELLQYVELVNASD